MSTPSKTVILTAPQGWGKTLAAKALQAEHGCAKVVDNWHASLPLTRGALHLTNVPPKALAGLRAAPHSAAIVSRGW